MRTLESGLSDHDLITLRVIGEWWELDLTGADKAACIRALEERLRELDLDLELNYLPPEESNALKALAAAGGKMPVGTFSRLYGEVRQMGPGRLEREEPWLDPSSPAEALWYRGFLYRGYDNADDGGGLVEYFFLPQEFYEKFPKGESEPRQEESADLSLSLSEAPATYHTAASSAVDDLTTILASAQQSGLRKEDLADLVPFLFDDNMKRNNLLLSLAVEMDLLRQQNGNLRPTKGAVGWLRQDREKQLRTLAEAWSGSLWNELCHTPGLRCEGSGWENEPILARTALLEAMPLNDTWYRIEDLVTKIKSDNPDFQRPEGNYDTWYIRDLKADAYLRGFENWDGVEGRLLRFIISGPMVWLGMAEVGEGSYRLTERALQWLRDEEPSSHDVKVPIVVQSDAIVLVPYNASRYQRFQVARIAEPQPIERTHPPQPYQYRLTPDSLARAQEAGIRTERVLEFLEEASGRPIPASMRRGVERWSERGLEGRLERVVILRVRDASILDTLQSNSKTRPYIGERLGDLAAVVQAENWRELQQVTAQLGLLLDAADRHP